MKATALMTDDLKIHLTVNKSHFEIDNEDRDQYSFRLYKDVPMIRSDEDYISVDWNLSDAFSYLRQGNEKDVFRFQPLSYGVLYPSLA